MSVEYACDACDRRAPARVTAMQIPGMRVREGSEESPVVYLPPHGWCDFIRRDGRRLHACGKACLDALADRETRESTGASGPAHCPACGACLVPARCIEHARDLREMREAKQ